MSGRPQSGWRTLGCRERIRLPSPAARMTAVSLSIGWISFYIPDVIFHLGDLPQSMTVTKMDQEPLHPSRYRRGEFDRFPESGMDEGQAGGVQGVAVEHNRRAQPGLAIHAVAHDRMAERGEMHTNLVGTPRLQMKLEQREVGEPLEHPIAGDRSLAPPGRSDSHLHAVARVAADRYIDNAFGGAHAAVNDGEIAARNGPRGELGHQVVVRGLRLGDHQQTGGVLVEAMHDSGATRSADPGDARRV